MIKQSGSKRENNKIKELQTNHIPKLLPNLELNPLVTFSIVCEANQLIQMEVHSLLTLNTLQLSRRVL